MSKVGKSEIRVDAFDKVTGRTKYYEDRMPAGALYARIKHSTIAHGFVKSVDKSAAEAIPGVMKVLTCFDVPEHCFPTAGHPWSMDPGHQDVADRNLLNRHVRYYGDDVAVVIAEDEVSAMQGVRALKVEYEELPFVLDVQKAMEPDAPQIHEDCPGNVLKHTDIRRGDYQTAIQEPGLIRVEAGTTPPLSSTATLKTTAASPMRRRKSVVVSSTQIPHIIRRVVGQALGLPWGKVRIIKPYIGGGFGNKRGRSVRAFVRLAFHQVGGRLVHLECSREETFVSNRVRHAIRTHIISYVRPTAPWWPGSLRPGPTRGLRLPRPQHRGQGHGRFPQLYPCDNLECDCWSVFTNRPAAALCAVTASPRPCSPEKATSTISAPPLA